MADKKKEQLKWILRVSADQFALGIAALLTSILMGFNVWRGVQTAPSLTRAAIVFAVTYIAVFLLLLYLKHLTEVMIVDAQKEDEKRKRAEKATASGEQK